MLLCENICGSTRGRDGLFTSRAVIAFAEHKPLTLKYKDFILATNTVSPYQTGLTISLQPPVLCRNDQGSHAFI